MEGESAGHLNACSDGRSSPPSMISEDAPYKGKDAADEEDEEDGAGGWFRWAGCGVGGPRCACVCVRLRLRVNANGKYLALGCT